MVIFFLYIYFVSVSFNLLSPDVVNLLPNHVGWMWSLGWSTYHILLNKFLIHYVLIARVAVSTCFREYLNLCCVNSQFVLYVYTWFVVFTLVLIH